MKMSYNTRSNMVMNMRNLAIALVVLGALAAVTNSPIDKAAAASAKECQLKLAACIRGCQAASGSADCSDVCRSSGAKSKACGHKIKWEESASPKSVIVSCDVPEESKCTRALDACVQGSSSGAHCTSQFTACIKAACGRH
jgi:hypothetical protein